MGTCDICALCDIFNICHKSNSKPNDNNINQINNGNINEPLIQKEKDGIIDKYSDKLIPKEKSKINDNLVIHDEKKNYKNYSDELISKDFNIINNDKNKKGFITVIFREPYQDYNFPIVCNDSDLFSEIEEKLYLEYPYLKENKIKGTNFNKIMLEELINDIEHNDFEMNKIIEIDSDDSSIRFPLLNRDLETNIKKNNEIILHIIMGIYNNRMTGMNNNMMNMANMGKNINIIRSYSTGEINISKNANMMVHKNDFNEINNIMNNSMMNNINNNMMNNMNNNMMNNINNNMNNLMNLEEDNLMINNKKLKDFIGYNKLCFVTKENKIDKSKTLKENNITDNSIIFIKMLLMEKINLQFFVEEPKKYYKISCYDIEIFSSIEQQLINENQELKEKFIIFKIDGNKIDKSLTLQKNNIKNNSVISVSISDKKEIKVTFCTIDQRVQHLISCYNSDEFLIIEKKLYDEVEELKNTYYFLANGNIVERALTFEENKITDNTIILIVEEGKENDDEKKLIAVIFKAYDEDLGINYAMPCFADEKFSTIEQKLYLKYPEIKGEEIYFYVGNVMIDKTKTLEENNIKNGTLILISSEMTLFFCLAKENTSFAITCFMNDLFSTVKAKLYSKYPEIKEKMSKLVTINHKRCTSGTIKDNNIKNGQIFLSFEDKENIFAEGMLITVTILTSDKKINYKIPCYIYENFSVVEERFYLKYPKQEGKNNLFIYNARILKKSETIEKNQLLNNLNPIIIFLPK